jgi:WD40 repeat protein
MLMPVWKSVWLVMLNYQTDRNGTLPYPSPPPLSSLLSAHECRNLTQDGKFLFTLRGHSAEVNALCFMPDSACLVTACENNIFRVWNYIDGGRLMIFDGYRGLSILSLAAVPNAHNAPWILVGGSHTKGYPNLNVEIWNTETGEKVANCRGCRYQICGIDVQRVLGEEGEESFVVVAGGLDCKTRCWSLDWILRDRHPLLHPGGGLERDLVIDLESTITNDSVLMSSYAEGSKHIE